MEIKITEILLSILIIDEFFFYKIFKFRKNHRYRKDRSTTLSANFTIKKMRVYH